MSKKLQLKPNIKAIKTYFKAIDYQYSIGKTREREIRYAIDDLLRFCSNKVDWSYHFEETDEDNNKRPDATLKFQNVPVGYLEAKDDHTKDLSQAVQKKFEDDDYAKYKDNNILFWQPKRIIIYQDRKKVFDDEIWNNPTKLTEALELFFNHLPFEIQNWLKEVDRFTKEIPELSATILKSISDAKKDNKDFREGVKEFKKTCQQAINKNISNEAVDEMFIQHIFIKQIYEEVFNFKNFISHNTIGKELQKLYEKLTETGFFDSGIIKDLEPFYDAIKSVASKMVEFSDKQNFLNTVFERFFQGWAVKTADRLGIVYTPQEVVDFMVRSVDHILKSEFGREKGLGSENVHIIDPFVGTGNFIVRVMKEIKDDDDLKYKYKNELHCNEISLMPYYIASMNISHEYYERLKGKDYSQFEGICFADTFQIFEDKINEDKEEQDVNFGFHDKYVTKENTERVRNQRSKDIFVVISNPPYNTNQANEMDNNKNRKYPELEKHIKNSYSKDSSATLRNKLMDPYVKAFKWASDRIGDEGVVAMITNNSFIDQYAFDGMRKHLEKDFDKIYLFDLKGNIRKDSMRDGIPLGEKHTVFGLQAMVGISISIFIKHKDSQEKSIQYFDVPFRSTREEKFEIVKKAVDVDGVEWRKLTPNKNHTWLTDGIADDFEDYPLMGDKLQKGKTISESIFNMFSLGVATNRDAWVYNFDKINLEEKMKLLINTYDLELEAWNKSDKSKHIDDFVMYDEKLIKWNRELKKHLVFNKTERFSRDKIRDSVYRPFIRKYLYFSHLYNAMTLKNPYFFPTSESEKENQMICVTNHTQVPFSVQILNLIPSLDVGGRPTQCFPFYVYNEDGTGRKENITDKTLEMYRYHYSKTPSKMRSNLRPADLGGLNNNPPGHPSDDHPPYQGGQITKWDIFYYIYAMLHHPNYREDFKENLKRSLPRIPFAPDFWSFSKIGKKLADIHLNYEDVEQYDLGQARYVNSDFEEISYKVDKMKLNKDKTELIYNRDITLKGIPKEVFEYKLGNRSALEWIIEQYQVKTDKRSGITQDPNNFDGNEKYIFDLVGKIVTVSLETVKLVKELSKLKYK